MKILVPRSSAVPALMLLVLCLACISPRTEAQTATIPLKSLPPNSRLAIWGDSITEGTLYPRYVEAYLLACAGRKDISVCTFGHSGETLSGLISRQSDLQAFHPTVVSFNYGMNDSQYSPDTPEKDAEFDRNLHAVLALLTADGIQQRIVAGPTAVDDTFQAADFHGDIPAGLTAAQSQNATLAHFRDLARAAAVETGSAFADVHNRMMESYGLAKLGLGPQYDFGKVHPLANGHLMIAYELLKALGCDGNIGSIVVDLTGAAHASAGHRVISVSQGAVVMESSRYPFCDSDDPFTRDGPHSMASILPYLPFSRDLNRLTLTVRHLDAAQADVTWGSQTRSFTRAQLSQGINLTAEFSQTPFDAAFARVMQAVADQQDFENYMIKGTSNYFGNDNGGNFDENMIAVDAAKQAAVRAAIVPVRYTIVIAPVGAPEAAAPVIAGTMTADASVGRPFTYQTLALHAPSRFTAAGLPMGLTLNEASGEITGVPTEPGTRTVTLTAANAHGSGTAILTVTVTLPRPDRPVITSSDIAAGTVGSPFVYQIIATNGPTAYFVTSPGGKGTVPPASSLPSGLAYDMATGLLSGTPRTAGTYPIQVAAMNDGGVATKLITLTVGGK